ncbi:spore germination protein GerPE [Neobacillus notoginsengisoli]|uniref:Spore germination protein GerPE n=1 Tax=Neobacillus notoginsengisoli TaxID=1578198 RepID=A0A417YZ58_9BACI|nr:spore germination protein GerPE [Neobacillus notoginsengisoli]RHW43162.1 spore germination protein GerPE [Neobacillus notoginsengisoli]
MLQRLSVVDSVIVKSVLFSSTIQIGDSSRIHGFSRAIALQREAEIFFDEEGDFNQFKVFSEPIFIPPITENITIAPFQLNPVIKVGTLEVTGLSAASIVQVGSTPKIAMESRIMHIRQLQPR